MSHSVTDSDVGSPTWRVLRDQRGESVKKALVDRLVDGLLSPLSGALWARISVTYRLAETEVLKIDETAVRFFALRAPVEEPDVVERVIALVRGEIPLCGEYPILRLAYSMPSPSNDADSVLSASWYIRYGRLVPLSHHVALSLDEDYKPHAVVGATHIDAWDIDIE